LGVALSGHPNRRLSVPAPLAAQRDVADEGVDGDAGRAQQELPGHVGNPAAPGARQAEVGITFGLRFANCPDSPVGFGFHGADIIARRWAGAGSGQL
jgi:hypothetical protein